MTTGLCPLRYSLEQIMPIRILCFDQRNFPVSPPFLHLFFSGDGGSGIIEDLEIHEPINGVPLRKTGDGLDAMFMNPSNEIIGDADVQCPVAAARQNVKVELSARIHA